jgi:hypothetical protein
MKALTVIQPYAYFICAGIKDIENRSWKTNIRGRILIHAGADKHTDKCPLNWIFTEPQIEDLQKYYTENELCAMKFQKSSIIGSVEIIDCVKNHPSVWAEKDTYNWVLKNPVLFREPITAVKGKLRFWQPLQTLQTLNPLNNENS